MGFSEGCGGFEFGVLHWAELAKPQRERQRERGKSGIFRRERTGRIFLKERVRERERYVVTALQV